MRNSITHKWSSYAIIFFMVMLGLFAFVTKAALEIQTDIDNAMQTIQKIYVTDDGLAPDGTNTLVELNPDGTQGHVNIKGDVQVGDTTKTSKIQVIGNFLAGDGNNQVDGDFSSIGGGDTNSIVGESSTILGGLNNNIDGNLSTIGGGGDNSIQGDSSNVLGGLTNNISNNSNRSTIGGGSSNTIDGNDSVIAGGAGNRIIGNYGFVAGGFDNAVTKDYGWVGGFKAIANNPGAFVWADSTTKSDYTDGRFDSTLDNSFLIYAANGVGINTNAPTSELDVKGTIDSDGFIISDGTAEIGKILVSLNVDGNASWRDLTVNQCQGSIPSHGVANGNGEFITVDVQGEAETRNWEYNEEYGSCHFVCAAGYVWLDNQCKEIINGQCATPDHTTSRYSTPSTFCTKGNFVWTDSSASRGDWQWNWQCRGENTGTTDSCYANKNVDGVCGSDHGKYLNNIPDRSGNLCNEGYDLTPTVKDNGGEQNRYTWTCAKVNNGTSASCSAHYYQRVRACNSIPNNAVYYNSTTSYNITQTTSNNGSSWSSTLTAYYGDGVPNANTCEYKCLAGYHYYNGQCVSNYCGGTNEPSGSQYVKGPNSFTSGPAITSWSPGSFPLSACKYNCKTGYELDGLLCVESNCPATTMTFPGPGKDYHTYSITSTSHDTSKAVTSETISISYGKVNYSMIVSCNEGAYTAGPETYNLVSCGTDYYTADGVSCTAVGNGYYSTNTSVDRHSCINKPSNSYYTSAGNGSATGCSWSCSSGYRNVNGSCVNTCTLDGITKTDGQAYAFYNKASGTCTTNNCGGTVSRVCDGETGLFGGDDSYDESSCTDNSNTTSCPISNGAGTKSCTAGSTTWGACYVSSCNTDYYSTAPNLCGPVGVGYYSPNGSTSRYSCTNKPSNSHYTTDGNGSNNCGWSCDTGFEVSGSSCVNACNYGEYLGNDFSVIPHTDGFGKGVAVVGNTIVLLNSHSNVSGGKDYVLFFNKNDGSLISKYDIETHATNYHFRTNYAVASDGTYVYVLGLIYSEPEVVIFNSAGSKVGSFTPNQGGNAVDLWVDSNYIYIAYDQYDGFRGIKKFSKYNKSLVSSFNDQDFGYNDSGQIYYNGPYSVAVSPNYIYVRHDGWSDRIKVFNHAGTFLDYIESDAMAYGGWPVDVHYDGGKVFILTTLGSGNPQGDGAGDYKMEVYKDDSTHAKLGEFVIAGPSPYCTDGAPCNFRSIEVDNGEILLRDYNRIWKYDDCDQSSCDAGYHLDNGFCVEDVTAPSCGSSTNTCSEGSVSNQSSYCGDGTRTYNWTCTTNTSVSCSNTVSSTSCYDGVCGTNGTCTKGTVNVISEFCDGQYKEMTWSCQGTANNTYCGTDIWISSDCGGGGGGCFVAGTKVTLPNGTKTDIESIGTGDVVLGSDQTPNKVVKTYKIWYEQPIYSINGSEYFVTDTHPFMTTEGWKSLNPEGTKLENPDLFVTQLEVGDILITDNIMVRINTLDYIIEPQYVYNFKLDGDHTYYADGYMVHNPIEKEVYR